MTAESDGLLRLLQEIEGELPTSVRGLAVLRLVAGSHLRGKTEENPL
jgi:hypothetical protein